MTFSRSRDLLSIFLRHRVAPNLLMWLMIAVGAWGLVSLNKQLLPSFDVNFVTVQVIWPGASADDVIKSVINPIERELRTVDYLKEMSSTARQGVGKVVLEFEQGTNMSRALEQVRERVSLVRNLPDDVEEVNVQKEEKFEEVASLIVTGGQNIGELRGLVRKFEQQLLDLGISKVDIIGLPEQEVAIQIPTQVLAKLNLSLAQVAQKVKDFSVDLPAGTIGRGESGRQLRSLQQQRNVLGFENLPLISDNTGRIIRVKDVGTVTLRPQDDTTEVTYQGKPAVEMILRRTENDDSLKSAELIHQWLKEVKPTLPSSVNLYVFDEVWILIKQRINLLLKNGLGGFVLILILLFFFLNRRVAWWVSVGIPVSFMMTLGIISLIGGSINMISMFAFIMSLGIIVDDTIVVGEEAVTQFQKGKPILEAVELGAKRMFVPIVASSLTTISAFIPLFLVGGIIGNVLMTIPMVVICVIIASLVECFLVLPGHLYRSLGNIQSHRIHPLRQKIDDGFVVFKEKYFRPFVTGAIEYRNITFSIVLFIIIIAVALIITGRINFTFFPEPDGTVIIANVQYRAGATNQQKRQFIRQLENTLWATNKKLSTNESPIVVAALGYVNRGVLDVGEGTEYGSMKIQVTEPDYRHLSNQEFINQWRKSITLPPIVSSLTIRQKRAGPPGQDIEIKLIGQNPNSLKKAANELKRVLNQYPGVSALEDNLPYGQEQFIYALSAVGEALGLTTTDVGRQLRAAFTGELAQVYHLPNEEIEVRVLLPDKERDSLSTLEKLPVITPSGDFVPMYSVVNINRRRGFDTLRHINTKLAITVEGQVDANVNNSNKILNDVIKTQLPKLMKKYNVSYQLGGRASDQEETLTDMKYAAVIAIVLIYLILAWVFASYGWPIIVMSVIPLAIIGALFGHFLMNKDVTILSLFGLFGLSGIIINDSIILLVRYKELIKHGLKGHNAIVEASCQRVRAVILTSMTTIAGLTPLLFEKSVQAQFLIPMAISLCFGIGFGTLLILVLVPTMLSVYEDIKGSL